MSKTNKANKSNSEIIPIPRNRSELEKNFNNLIALIINLLIIYYLYNLEYASCNCITDWRHNYIKYVALFNIFINILHLLSVNIKIPSDINSLLNLINIYAFYTYIRDLNDTKCECAVVKQDKLNNFLNIWRYIIVIFPILALIYVFINVYSMSPVNKKKFYTNFIKE